MPFAIGTLGASNLSGTAEDSITQLELTFNQPTAIYLGLLNPTTTSGGFDSLTFTITEDGTTVVSRSFASSAAANGYFTDNVLTLGAATDLALNLEINSSNLGDGYSLNFEAAAVPEPSTTALVGVGILLLALQTIRKWRQRCGTASIN